MKYLPIIILLSLLMNACQYSSRVQTALDKADRKVFTEPDSAVTLLDSLDLSSASTAQRARHALLLTKAHTKAHIDFTNDSLIYIASDYYRGRGDSLEVQSLFYHGAVLKNRGDYSEALIMLMEAAERATDTGDYFYYAMACREQAEIYASLYEFEQAAEFGRQAVDAFEHCGLHSYALFSQIELAQALAYSDRATEAYELVTKLDSDSLISADPHLQAYFYNIACSTSNMNDDTDNAIRYFDKIIDLRYIPQSKLFSMMSKVYLIKGDRIKAWEMIEKAQETSSNHIDSLAIATSLVELYADRGDYEEAYRMQSITNRNIDQATNHLITHPYTALINRHYQSESGRKSVMLKDAVRKTVGWIIVSAILMLLILITILFWRRSRRLRLLEKDILLDTVNRLEKQVSLLSSKNASVSTEKKFAMPLINSICEARRNMSLNEEGLLRFGKNISVILTDLTKPENLQALEIFINDYNDRLMEHFITEVPGITEKERIAAIFIFLGFSNLSIATLMKYKSTNNVRQLRYKIKSKVMANPSKYTEIFMSYIEAETEDGRV